MEPTPRRAARLLVIDPISGAVLLFQYEDGGRRWWATPGGALDGDETFEEAAIREATEELTVSSRRFLPLCASWVNRDKCFHHALLGMPCCNTPSPPRLPENSIPIAKANFEKGGDDAPRRTLCTVQNAR